jgi:hypothetical protein
LGLTDNTKEAEEWVQEANLIVQRHLQKNLQSIELRVLMDNNQEEAHFWQAGQKHKTLIVSGLEEQVIYISDNPIPESLSSWVQMVITEGNLNDRKSFDLSIKWYGLKSNEVEIMNDIKQRFETAVYTKTSLAIELSSFFNPTEWTLTPSS